MSYPKVASFKTTAAFRAYLRSLQLDLELDDEILSAPDSPLAQPIDLAQYGGTPQYSGAQSLISNLNLIGNRFAILPMEGWDGTEDGKPSSLTIRRWRHFGESGAKLIWGGEAVAVRHDGRANPNQLMINEENLSMLEYLREELVKTHGASHGRTDDLLVGLQLTHSGRYAKPNSKTKSEPLILYHHPFLDKRLNLPADYPVMTDAQIDDLIADFVRAAVRAQKIGFHFVDVKHCHGYLGHELLSAFTRPGKYGGSFENRTRFLREVVAGIRRDAPGLGIGVRLSAFDLRPFRKGHANIGEIEPFDAPYPYAFGCNQEHSQEIDLGESAQFLQLLRDLDIRLVCLTGGSPYYNPHIQRPAAFPPSDGYQPPEDPLAGVARQIKATATLKQQFPDLIIVGSAYSYLQEYLPQVAQYQVRAGNVDIVGLGRMVLAYPTLPADVLSGRKLNTKSLCRTFSDCTTAPRNGMVSGCYPLDAFYKARPENEQLKRAKKPA
ncbi:MAG: NADH:flavin oxidoreductase [Chloroflexi bacterium]|nr:NADH:flavin oxidoreductase [Chloroflexota bacterium]